MKKPVTVICVLVGLALLLASSVWPYLASSETYWGDQEQAEFSEALGHAHQLELRQTTGKTAASKEAQAQELAAARAHWDNQLAKLDEAKDASQRPARICFWAGVASLVAGV